MVVCESSGIPVETGFVNQNLEFGGQESLGLGQESSVARLHVYSPSLHDVLRQVVGAFQIFFQRRHWGTPPLNMRVPLSAAYVPLIHRHVNLRQRTVKCFFQKRAMAIT